MKVVRQNGRSSSCIIAVAFSVIALIFLLLNAFGDAVFEPGILAAILLVGVIAGGLIPRAQSGLLAGLIGCLSVIFAAWAVLNYVHTQLTVERAGLAIWALVIAMGFLSWRGLELLSAVVPRRKITQLALSLGIPVLFGAWLFFLWEALTTGFLVPQVLLPAPSLIGKVMSGAGATLAADFHQTFVRAVIPGFIMGSSAGFITAIAADRVPFLQRGLLPIGNLISAIPIVGIAPIMVMWFGFDWQSKAAVVAIMTFFPMLVNTLTGLADSGRIEHDLLRTYASGYWRELFSLRLPNALPFILNALKINSTLAMIGAIVAEFFGTPIVGMGFRISTEVGRMNIDMVWATIAVAALAGSLFYGLFAIMERVFTFWHPSMRKR